MKIWKRMGLGVISGVIASFGVAATATAAGFPDRPLKLIVPFAAGGPTDVTARIFSKAIGEELRQQVVVENRPGAGGTVGGGMAAKADADGYTLLWGGTSTMAVAPSLFRDLPYDPLTSFQPVSRAARGPLVLAVNSSIPVKNVAELIAYAKERPGKLNFGSAGVGSIIHLTGEMFKSRAGIEMEHVPYKGNAHVMTDLTGGVLHMAFVSLGHILPHMHDGKLQPIAITSLQRNPLAPDLPTFDESGLPGFESMEWFGLVAPAGIPEEAVTKLNQAFRVSSSRTDVREGVAALGYDSVDESPDDFRQAMKTEAAKWRSIIAEAGIELQ